jgi:hypothetical protein
LSTTLSKIWLSVGPFFHSFDHNSLVSRRFWPVKCRIEALITFFRMVKERSVQFSFRSGQRSGQTLVKLSQPWSNLVKILRTLGNVSWAAFRGFLGIADPSRVRNGLVKPRSNLVNSGQTWSDLGKCVPDPVLRLFGVMSPRRNMPTWFGLSRFACRHPRKFRG